MNSKVSIIIPIYNTFQYLQECIQSVLSSTYKNLEIILINDGSTDNSIKIIRDFQQKYKDKIIVIDKKNEGVSMARNDGIKVATGKYIIFVDSDDVIKSNMIEILINRMETNNVGLVACSYYKKYINNIDPINFSEEGIFNKEEFFNILLKTDSVQGYLWNKIFITDVIKTNNLTFDKNIKICEDLLFCFQYIQCIDIAEIINIPLYFYRMRKSSTLNINQNSDNYVFYVFSKLYEINKQAFNNNKNLYMYIFFKYYNKKVKLYGLPKISIFYLLKEKKINMKTKVKYILNRFLPNKIKYKLKQKNKQEYFD